MGTTAQKLSYLNETKTKLKDKINLMGANITDDTFRSYPDKIKDGLLDIMNNGYEKVWNNWDKVTGSGTEPTLNNTEEAPMKLEYKGNTSQFSTTGRNLCPYGTQSFTTYYQESGLNIPAGTYNISALITSSDTGQTKSRVYFYDANGSANAYADLSRNTRSNASVTLTTTITRITLYSSIDYATSNGKTATYEDIMMNTGSSAMDYEPYTGGIASPNPDYPQEVKVVKGDNIIKVEGKNLFNKNATPVYENVYLNTNNGNAIQANDFCVYRIDLKPNTNYVIQGYGQSNAPGITFYDSNDTFISGISFSNRKKIPITTPAETSYALVSVVEDITSYRYELDIFQIERGSTATDYVTYEEPSEYEIDLGVENLLSTKNYGSGSNGVGITSNENNVLEVSGTATSNTNVLIEFNDITLKAGTYYFYLLRNTTTRVDIALRTTANAGISGANFGNVFQNILSNKSFTLEEDTIIHSINFYYPSGTTATDTYKIMICKETHTEKEFTEYGKAVELAKINTYQDKIIGNSGKNLWNEQYDNLSSTLNYKSLYVGDGTFTMSSNIPYNASGASIFFLAGSVSTGASTGTNDVRTGVSRTQTSVDGYVTIAYRNFDNPNNYNTMLNKGSTALDYEPYGTGKWYKKELVGKVVYNGTESWVAANNSKSKRYFYRATVGRATDNNVIADTFKNITTWTLDENIYAINGSGNNTSINIMLGDTSIDTNVQFSNWLSTHNTKVYYVLETPVYKLLPNTLQEQLNNIVKSYKSQTNITQENEGLPFELDVVALESI